MSNVQPPRVLALARNAGIVVVGLAGYLLATAALVYEALFTSGGPDDAIATGIVLSWLIVAAVSGALVFLGRRVRKPAQWLWVGAALGLVLHVTITVAAIDLRASLWSGCPCEPLIERYEDTGYLWPEPGP